MKNYDVIGQSYKKSDAYKKVTGEAIFAADLFVNEMIYGKVLRSKVGHAKVKSIDISKALEIPGVVNVLTYKDIPGENGVGIILKEEPVLVEDKIRRVGDAIALIGAETKEIAEKAMELIKVEYEELPVVTDVFEAIKEDSPKVHGKSNILTSKKMIKGDVEEAFKQCDIVVENEYKTGRIAHMFIEPEAILATYCDGVLEFKVSTQNIHFDRNEVSRVLGIPNNRVKGIQMTTGGGFGGKLDISVQCHAALLAYHTGRPVKMVNTREESMYISSKRHPYFMKYKTGATKDGKLLALKATIYIDTGAYASYGPGVITRGIVHSTGPYEIPNVLVEGVLVYTNNPMCGAMRGFGVPQVAFAHESQMDILAEKLNISPFDIRLKNALSAGKRTGTNQLLESSVGIKQTITVAKEKSEEIIGERR